MRSRPMWLLVLGVWGAVTGAAAGQQVADTAFVPEAGAPAYPVGTGPLVLVDGAHSNFHTIDGRFAPFARLLRRDGYRVEALNAPLDAAGTLQGAALLVIANALGASSGDVAPSGPAFTPQDVRALREWVERGGALLLIADHMPFPAAVRNVGTAFGIELIDGFASADTGFPGAIVFSRARGTLADHPITRGRTPAERIDSVATFVGEAFRAGGADPLLTMDEGAVVFLPRIPWQIDSTTPREAAVGWSQGVVKRVGKGRIAVFGEAAMFTAQLAGPERSPVGMNAPEAGQNGRFVLNLVRWMVERGRAPTEDSQSPAAARLGHDPETGGPNPRFGGGLRWLAALQRVFI